MSRHTVPSARRDCAKGVWTLTKSARRSDANLLFHADAGIEVQFRATAFWRTRIARPYA
jgi:hypothetical protein